MDAPTSHDEDGEGPVTVREFYRALGDIKDQIAKRDRLLILLAAAVFSPKLGGPDPSKLVGLILGF